jgi:hypothetical protein
MLLSLPSHIPCYTVATTSHPISLPLPVLLLQEVSTNRTHNRQRSTTHLRSLPRRLSRRGDRSPGGRSISGPARSTRGSSRLSRGLHDASRAMPVVAVGLARGSRGGDAEAISARRRRRCDGWGRGGLGDAAGAVPVNVLESCDGWKG